MWALVLAAVCSLACGQVLVPFGSTWTYFDGAPFADGVNTWRMPTFTPDATWRTAAAPLGYGVSSGLVKTTIGYGPTATKKYITSYFRKSVTAVFAAAATGNVTLDLLADDGAVVSYAHCSAVSISTRCCCGTLFLCVTSVKSVIGVRAVVRESAGLREWGRGGPRQHRGGAAAGHHGHQREG
jgi:hypothetical protein